MTQFSAIWIPNQGRASCAGAGAGAGAAGAGGGDTSGGSMILAVLKPPCWVSLEAE